MKRILIFFIGLMWLESAFSAVDAQQNLAPEISTWKCRNGFVRMSGEGPNGTIALYYQRPADGVYALSPMPTKKLKPMTKYKFGAWVKAKNIVPSKGIGASLYVEYSKNGKHISGSGRYPKGVTGTKDWTLVTGETITPKDFTLWDFISGMDNMGRHGSRHHFFMRTNLDVMWILSSRG